MAVLFAIMAGAFAVLQTGINKIMSETWGFSSALLLNGLVFLVFNFILFGLVWAQPRWFPSGYLLQGQLSDFKWLWVLPGIFGFFLVMGLTVASQKIGAVPTFVISIAAQIIVSITWDTLVDSKPVTMMKLTGAVLTFAGAFIATR